MTGDAAILALKYAEGSTGPETIVLKYAKDLEANRVLAQEANMYEKETFFYRELHRSAPPLRRPSRAARRCRRGRWLCPPLRS